MRGTLLKGESPETPVSWGNQALDSSYLTLRNSCVCLFRLRSTGIKRD